MTLTVHERVVSLRVVSLRLGMISEEYMTFFKKCESRWDIGGMRNLICVHDLYVYMRTWD